MCGIAGIYSKQGKNYSRVIKEMTDKIRHRGPDDEGFYVGSYERNTFYELTGKDSKIPGERIEDFSETANLFLGHRRLSILDLSPMGHQPMLNARKNIAIIYNGEIYNYIEIKEELKSLGCCFRTNSDTEVLLTAYEVWGEKCLEKLNGMWVFVIFDKEKNVLFGARDRFGVKPFYYYIDNEHFAFASEIKALINLPFYKKEINNKAVYDYLVLNQLENDEEGFFKDIFELKPSFSFTYNLKKGDFKKYKYYNLQYENDWEKFNGNRSESYIKDIRELTYNAVKLRLRSDVPVGSCLSGGLDSSSVVCIVNDLFRQNNITHDERQKAFTASYYGSAIDESRWAKIVAEKSELLWYQTHPTAYDLAADMEDLVKYQEIPFGSTSIYSQYKVMKLAKENEITVLLDGQGADELFAGYMYFYRAFYYEMMGKFKTSNIFSEFYHNKNSPISSKELTVLLIKAGIKKYFPFFIKKKLINISNFENKYINKDFLNNNVERMKKNKAIEFLNLNDSLYDQFTFSSLKNLLKYEDRNSMRFSIESRTPFADDINLIEYVFNIPSVYKIHKGWSKYLLREAMKGVIPDEIRIRTDKIGFATPEYEWMFAMKDKIYYYLTDDLNEYFNVNDFKNELYNILIKQVKFGITNIWRFINLAVWKKVYEL